MKIYCTNADGHPLKDTHSRQVYTVLLSMVIWHTTKASWMNHSLVIEWSLIRFISGTTLIFCGDVGPFNGMFQTFELSGICIRKNPGA
jgi:hypothetical protein